MCVDSLFRLHPDYPKFGTNIFNIANYFMTYGKEKNLDELITWYSTKTHIAKSEFYERWLSRTGLFGVSLLSAKMDGFSHNPNLDLTDTSTIKKIFNLYYGELIKESINQDDLNFNLALYYKHLGAMLSKIYTEQGVMKPLVMDSLFEKAVEHYLKVSPGYLDGKTEITVRKEESLQIQQMIKRKYLFLYPDHFPKVFNNRVFATKYFTDEYFTFLLRSGHFSNLYKTSNDLNQINIWLSNYYETKSYTDELNYSVRLKGSVLVQIDSVLSSNPSSFSNNNNMVRLLLINYYIDNHQTKQIDGYYKKLQINRLTENLKESITLQKDIYYLINKLAGYLAGEGRIEDVNQIASLISNPVNRINTYSLAARQLMAGKGAQQHNAFVLMDSAASEFSRIKDFEFTSDPHSGSNDPRKAIVLSLSWIGGQEIHKLAGNYVEQISLIKQNDIIARWIEGTAGSGQYYLAYASIPAISPAGARLNYFTRILLQEAERRPMEKEWKAAISARLEVYKWEFLTYETDYF